MDYSPTLPALRACRPRSRGSPFSEEAVPAVPAETEAASSTSISEFFSSNLEDCSREKPREALGSNSSIYGYSRQRGDAYGCRAHFALDAICAIQAPEGLMVWLSEHSLVLYERLTRNLPNEISRAWNAQIGLAEFDVLCSRLVDTFQKAADLYTISKRTPKRVEHSKHPNPGGNFQS